MDSNSITEKVVVKEDTVINANSLPHTSKGSQMIFNNNNNTKISNLEPAGHSVCFTEAPQQQQNKSFNCFYCSKSHSYYSLYNHKQCLFL